MESPFQPVFYGAVTVSERGQIALPVKAREELHIKRGEKLMVIRGPMGGLMIIRADDLMAEMAKMRGMVDLLSQTVEAQGEPAAKSKGDKE